MSNPTPVPVEIDADQTTVDYMNRVANYHLGLDWMRVCPPAALTKQQAARARQQTYRILRQLYPERFPAGHSFK